MEGYGMRKNVKLLIAMAIIATVVLSGVAGAKEVEKSEVDKVLAQVGDVEIKGQDVEDVIKSLDPQQRMYYENEQGRKAILEELVNLEVFVRWAQENDVEKDPIFIERLENIKREILRQVALEKMFGNVSVSEKEARDYYTAHVTDFMIPSQIRASHILVDNEEEAKRIREEIKTEKITFEDAAQKYSSCPSKEQKGDLGYFQSDQVVPEFSQAAGALKKGEISAPVKTQYGWHIIRLEDKKPGSLQPFEEVKGQIETNLLREKRAQIYTDETERLRKQYGVKVFENKQ